MKPYHALLLAIVSLSAPVPAAVQDAHPLPEPARPTVIPTGIDVPGVYLDRPGDGALWARGRRWKASFDSAGATYWAGFGPRQARSIPHSLSPDLVTVGGQALAFDRSAEAQVFGQRVEIDRGAFVETYELGVDSIEQLFVFDALPRAGEIVVNIPVASELAGTETDAGLEFRGENGRVTYSRAVAIDARGRRAAAPTRLVDGQIRITVGADFLAGAALPLVIDPVVSQFWLDSFVEDRRSPDMVWDPFHQVWMAVYEEIFSATDTDVVVKMLNASGVLSAQGYVDFTSTSWIRPRIANNGSSHRCLVVAERTSSTPKTSMGRMVYPNGTIITMDSQFDLGGTISGDKLTPDVGGDPRTTGSTNFCVVFERTITSGGSEMAYRMVTSLGAPVGTSPSFFAAPTGSRDKTPTISRSNGGTNWLVAWIHESSFPLFDGVTAARINAAGTVVTIPFAVSGSNNNFDFSPSASSPLAGTERCLITFARRPLVPIGSTADIRVAALDGATVLQSLNLTALEASGQQAQEQHSPSVDSDGQHFLVAYSEFDPVFGHDNVFASDLFLSGGQLGLAQSHVQLHSGLGLTQRASQVAAMRSPSGVAHRYGVIYEVRANDQNFDISAVLFDGVEGGSTSPICGSNNGTACPCGNQGASGNGCANSANAAGAGLAASGRASTVSDTLRLEASGMPSTTTCLFFQGSAQNAAAAFGDGLLCTGGTVIRLATKTAASGAAQYPAAGSSDPAISVRGAVPLDGGARFYQVWYRNSADFCTTATFNTTSGVAVNWAR